MQVLVALRTPKFWLVNNGRSFTIAVLSQW